MAIKIYISGAFLISEDSISREPYFKVKKDKIHHLRNNSDQFAFFQDLQLPMLEGQPQYNQLGIQPNWAWDAATLQPAQKTQFDFSEIVDEAGVAYTSATVLDDYLNANLGFFENPNPVEIVADAQGLLTQEYLLEVAMGNVIGKSLVNKFGSAQSISTSLTVVATAKTYQTPTALTSLELVSTDNTNDIPTGSGARSVQIFGIGTGYVEVSEVVQLNVTTPVATTSQYYRIYRMKIIDSGQYASPTQSSHNSTISTQVAGGGTVWAQMVPEGTFGLGQSEIAAYTVPAGKTGYLISKNITIESTKSASVFLFVREDIDVIVAPFGAMRSIELDRNINERIDKYPKGIIATLPEKTDCGFMAKATTGTTAMSIEFEILLVDN